MNCHPFCGFRSSFHVVDVISFLFFPSGRKLGCSGDRPQCKTCEKRGGVCQYESTARRRGPGKAPRGSRKLAKGRGASSRTRRSTPEGEHQPTFPGVSFEVPFPRMQVPGGTNDYNAPPGNCEESEDRQWRTNSAFLNSYSSPGWGVT